MVLNLTLRRKWFDQICAGTKKIEYRENKTYWNARLDGKKFQAVCFVNGYGRTKPRVLVECLRIKKNNDFYHIFLGRILGA